MADLFEKIRRLTIEISASAARLKEVYCVMAAKREELDAICARMAESVKQYHEWRKNNDCKGICGQKIDENRP